MNNLLKNEKSPYLKQHENNPVHWHPWNKEALQKASGNYTMYYLAALRLQDEFGDYHREDHKRLTLLLQKKLDKYYVSMYNNKKTSKNMRKEKT